MEQVLRDRKWMFAIILSHLLIGFTFTRPAVFWYLLTGAMLCLISYAMIIEKFDDRLPLHKYFYYGLASGIFFYALALLAYGIIDWLSLSFLKNEIIGVYDRFSPDSFWHYIVLALIIVPGEEIFFRGFLFKRLLNYLPFWQSALLSGFLYAMTYIYSQYIILIAAAFFFGILWSALYAWKKSLPLVILSHLTFDLLLFLIFPLH